MSGEQELTANALICIPNTQVKITTGEPGDPYRIETMFPFDIEAAAKEIAKLQMTVIRLQRENNRLQGVVNTLPKTKDGVLVTPGMQVYYTRRWAVPNPVVKMHVVGWDWLPLSCYSTPEVADAALREQTEMEKWRIRNELQKTQTEVE